MKVLFIDNFDSFSFNLVDDLRRRDFEVEVWRNDIATDHALDRLHSWNEASLLMISPGPGTPKDAGCCIDLIRKAAGAFPIFGVCLGHQAIVEAFGGRVGRAGETVHGKPASIEHTGQGLFAGLPSPMTVARYHSLVAQHCPPELTVTAQLKDMVMAVEHIEHKIAGVQFHPESLLTPLGGTLFQNLPQWMSL